MSKNTVHTSNQPIVILGALDQEINAFHQELEGSQKHFWNGYEIWQGRLQGRDVVVTKSGVGKVFASMICQMLIDRYNPQALIFTGLAGGLSPKLEIGDIVVSRDCVQHDFTAAPLFPRYEIPSYDMKTTHRDFYADKHLKQLALGYIPQQGKIVEGRILTGDQFLTGSELEEYQHLTRELTGDAVDMESAAVAQVCTINQIPFVIIRTISDKANGQAARSFENFLPEATHNSVEVVKRIVANLRQTTQYHPRR